MARHHRRFRPRRLQQQVVIVVGVLFLIGAAFVGYTTTHAFNHEALVRDIAPGERSSIPSNFTAVNGILYFAADDGGYGRELWRSDGTRNGTWMVSDVVSGPDGSTPNALTPVGHTLYFVASDHSGPMLWSTNGTRNGTHVVRRFAKFAPEHLTAAGSLLFFSVQDATGAATLWRSDGTAAGTVALVAAGAPAELTDVHGTLLFTAVSTGHGRELWQSDGTTSGTKQLVDISPGGRSSFPTELTAVGTKLFFVADNGSYRDGRELWSSDGTASGTQRVRDINPGPGSSLPEHLTAAGTILYFTAYSPAAGEELWRSNGTSDGTTLVRDMTPGVASSSFTSLTAVNSTLYFLRSPGASDFPPGYPFPSQTVLWRSDGTAQGTAVVRDDLYNPHTFEAVGNALFFLTGDNSFYTQGVWRTDGTAQGTQQVGSYVDDSGSLQQNGELRAAGDFVFTLGQNAPHGIELWALPADPEVYVIHSVYLPVVSGVEATYTPCYPYPPLDVSPSVVPTSDVPTPEIPTAEVPTPEYPYCPEIPTPYFGSETPTPYLTATPELGTAPAKPRP